MANKRVRYAVVGLGNIAQVAVLPAFEHARENSELRALISSDQEKLRELGKKYNVPLAGDYSELERIIAEGQIEAVYVATPNSLHREFVERSARAGAHVLCEKPMALTEEDCEAMLEATRKAGVKLMIAYRLHFEASNLRAIERIKAGDIGEPRIFSSVFCHQVREGDIRTRQILGGGALFDMGIYCVNAARYLFCDEPLEVFAWQVAGTDERSKEVDEVTTAIVRFPHDRVAQFTASQGASDVAELRVVGTKGDIRLDPSYEYVDPMHLFLTVGGELSDKSYPKRDQFAPELIHFSTCILENEEPEPSGDEGLADVRVLQAIARSAKTGVPVSLAPWFRSRRPTGDLEINKPHVKKVETVHAPSPSK